MSKVNLNHEAAETLGAPLQMWPLPLAASEILEPEDDGIMIAPLPARVMIGPPLPA